jgi:site-specific recombinase XerD
MLVEMNTSLPVITNILGHTNSNTTAIYLKTDIEELAQCVLSPEVGDYE